MSASIAWIICRSPIGAAELASLGGVPGRRLERALGDARRPGPRSPVAIARTSASRSRSPGPPRRAGSPPARGGRRTRARPSGEPRIPILCSSRVTLKPGRSVSTTIADSRRLDRSASGLVTANTTTRSATLAWLMNRLPPSMTYSSPSRTACVRMPDGSEPGVGLGEGERDELLARGEARQPAVLLLGRAGDLDRDRAERLHGEHEARRRARTADLLDGEAQGQQVRAEAAVSLCERDREDVVAREEPAERRPATRPSGRSRRPAGRSARPPARGPRRAGGPGPP